MPSKRSDRARLQDTVGELGQVHPYRQRIESMRQPLIGWWMTPTVDVDGCECALCRATRAGRDVHLGSITRTAIYEAARLAVEHDRPSPARAA